MNRYWTSNRHFYLVKRRQSDEMASKIQLLLLLVSIVSVVEDVAALEIDLSTANGYEWQASLANKSKLVTFISLFLDWFPFLFLF